MADGSKKKSGPVAIDGADVPFAHGLKLQEVHHMMTAFRSIAMSEGCPKSVKADLLGFSVRLEEAMEKAIKRYVEDEYGEDGKFISMQRCDHDEKADKIRKINDRLDDSAEDGGREANKPRDDN